MFDATHMAYEATNTGGMVDIDTAITATLETLTQLADSNGPHMHPKGAPTGFKDIDELTGGIWPGEVMCVTGVQGSGTTSFALNVAVNAGKAGIRVLLFELEASAIATTLRLIASEERLPLAKLRSGRVWSEDWEAICNATNNLAWLDLHICDDPLLAPEMMRAVARNMAEQSERTLIVLDGPKTDEAKWYIALKEMARVLEVPALMAAPFAIDPHISDHVRNAMRNRRLEPLLDLLGEPARVADTVVILNGPSMNGPGSFESFKAREANSFVADVHVAKNRVGETGWLQLVYLKHSLRFLDYIDDELDIARFPTA